MMMYRQAAFVLSWSSFDLVAGCGMNLPLADVVADEGTNNESDDNVGRGGLHGYLRFPM